MQKYVLIALGGGLGSVLRYWVGSTVGGRMGVRFPFGTLVVNLTACVVIGFALTWFGERAEVSPAWRYLVAVGFIGAYSTFSTYEWETLSTLRLGRLRWPLSMRWAAWCLAWRRSGAAQRWPKLFKCIKMTRTPLAFSMELVFNPSLRGCVRKDLPC